MKKMSGASPGSTDRLKACTPEALPTHPGEAVHHRRVGEHLPERFTPGPGQFKQAGQGGPPGSRQAFGPHGQIHAFNHDAFRKPVDRLVRQRKVFRRHHVSEDEVTAQVPEIELLFVDVRIRIPDVDGGVGQVGFRVHPAGLSVRTERWRRVGITVSGFVQHHALFRRQFRHPFRLLFLPRLRSCADGLNGRVSRVSVHEQPLRELLRTGTYALKQGRRAQQQVACLQRRLNGQSQVVLPGQHVFGGFHVAFVAARDQRKPAVSRVRVGKRPHGVYPLAVPAAVEDVVGPSGIHRFIAANQAAGSPIRVADQLRFAVQPETVSDELVQVPNQHRMDHQVAERLPMRRGPSQHPVFAATELERRVAGFHLFGRQDAP